MIPASRFKVFPRALSFLLLVGVGACLPGEMARAVDSLQTSDDDLSSVADKAKPAVVQVRSGDKGLVLAGSGFFIDNSGTLVTSSTILGDNTTARVIINGVEVDAKVVGNDPRSGLAVLRVQYGESPFLVVGHSDGLKSGNPVVMVGFPMNLPVGSSQGVVTGFDASYLERIPDKAIMAEERFATTHIHADVAISPGEVGGPLLNANGEVVGMVATSPDSGRSVYALPVEAMTKIMNDFSECGHARHGWVGVNVTLGPDTDHDGRLVRVTRAVPGTPAAASGIMPGDTVMRIDSREIYRPTDVIDASFFSKVGGNMTVVVRRDERLYNYTFAVIERPTDQPAPTIQSAPNDRVEWTVHKTHELLTSR